jgi:glycosyltransferase involved in cell wall biosynthesis
LFVSVTGWLGGPTRSLATVLAHLDGVVARTLAAPSEGDFIPVVEERGLADERLVIPRGRRVRGLHRFVAAVRILRWTREHRRELRAIHANGLAETNVAALAAVVYRVPLVVWVHAFEPSPWTRRLAPVWQRLLKDVRWAAVSDTAAGVAESVGLARRGEVAVVPNPIDPDEFRGKRRPRASGPVVIGFFGHAAHYKGFDLLPDVVGLLRDLDVRFVLFGPTEDNSPPGMFDDVWRRLEALPPDRLELAGRLQDVRPAYARSDIVFCPSRQESFCRVAAEAMVNGVAVVASDLPPLRELLGDEDAGIVFPVGDVEAAAAALERLATDRPLRERLGGCGRERAERFRPDVVVDSLLDLYGGRPRGGESSRASSQVS